MRVEKHKQFLFCFEAFESKDFLLIEMGGQARWLLYFFCRQDKDVRQSDVRRQNSIGFFVRQDMAVLR